MITSAQALAAAAQKVPAYCSGFGDIHTPQQWQTCWKLGYNLPTTGAANAATGGVGSAVLIVLVVVAALWLLSKLGGSRSPATSRN